MSTYERLVRALPSYYTPGPHLSTLLGAWAVGIDLLADEMAAIPGPSTLLMTPSLWTNWVAELFGVVQLVNESEEHLLLRLVNVLQPRLSPEAIVAYLNPVATAPVTYVDNSGGRTVGWTFEHYRPQVVPFTVTYTRASEANTLTDGALVGVNAPVYGSSALGTNVGLALWRATTNVLSSGLATAATTSGWTPLGTTTLAVVDAPVWQGLTSVAVTAGVSGGLTTTVAIASGTEEPWTFSTWVSAPSGAALTVQLYDGATDVLLGTTTVTVGTAWEDIAVTGVTAVTTATLDCTVMSADATTFYVGAAQVEQQPYATPWQNPLYGARALPTVTLPLTDFPIERGTFETVITPGGMATPLSDLLASAAWPIFLTTGSGGLSVIATDTGITAAISGGAVCTVPLPSGWTHGGLFSVTWDLGTVGLYFNGNALGTATGTVLPSAEALYIGTDPATASAWDGVLGPWRILEQARFGYEFSNDWTWYQIVALTAYNNGAATALFPPVGTAWANCPLGGTLAGLQGSQLTGAAWYGQFHIPVLGGQGLTTPFTVDVSAFDTNQALVGNASLTPTAAENYSQIFTSVRPAGVKLELDVV